MYDECKTAASTWLKTILVVYIAWFCHRRWFAKRTPEQSPDPQPTEAETTDKEFDLLKMT